MGELISKLLLYMVTGGIAAIVDAGGFAILIKTKLGIVLAGTISFGVAALVNYRLTSQFVFNRNATMHGFALFLFAALTGLTVNVGVTVIGVFLLALPALVAKGAG